MDEQALRGIYASQVHEAVLRLNVAADYLSRYEPQHPHELDSAALQIRKSLECIAFSAIAPDRQAYASLRAASKESADFTKDYHAKRIFRDLAKVNKEFYPMALIDKGRTSDSQVEFAQRTEGILTQEKFERVYDRLGKYLHAQNPWAQGRQAEQLAADLPQYIDLAYALLELHVRFIHTPRYHAAWLVKAPRNGSKPFVYTGIADGPFAVNRGG